MFSALLAIPVCARYVAEEEVDGAGAGAGVGAAAAFVLAEEVVLVVVEASA